MKNFKHFLFANCLLAVSMGLHAAVHTPFTVFYPLNQTTTVKPTVTGNASATDEILGPDVDPSLAYTYSIYLVGPTGDTVSTVPTEDRIQRTLFNQSLTANPLESALNPGRYVQFSMAPNTGTKLSIDSIGLYAGGNSTNVLRFAAMASTNPSFNPALARVDTLAYRSSGNLSNCAYAVSSTKNWTINGNDTLYLRVYFWNSTNKYFLIKNVTIQGTVSELPTIPVLTSFAVGDVNANIDQTAKTITMGIDASNPIFNSLSSVTTSFGTYDDETTVTIGGTPATSGNGIDYSSAGNGLKDIPVILTNSAGSETYYLTINKYNISAFSVFYPLSQTTNVIPTITGNVTALDESFSNASAEYTSAVAGIILDSGDTIAAPVSVQRCGLPTLTDAWPKETVPNLDRYVQFAVSPQTGTSLVVDSIGLYVGGAASGGVKFVVRSSTSSDFSTYNTIIDRGTAANGNGYLYPGSFTQAQTIADGETLYIRAYFWQNGSDAARRFIIKNVAIEGTVWSEVKEDSGPPTAITAIDNSAELVAIKYYNLQGIEVVTPEKEIYIAKKMYSNNTVKIEKLIIK